MVTCKICKKSFKKVTNSHLRDKHNVSIEDYLRMFPDSQMTDQSVRESIASSTKGKSYLERYGKELAEELVKKRQEAALNQFKDIDQRVLRRCRAWKGYKDISGYYWTSLQSAAAKKGYYDITIEYIWDLFEKQQGRCKLSGLPIVLETSLGSMNKNGYQKRTASLDRIDSSKGYLKENVQWVHKDINQMKSSRSDKVFIELCKAVALHNETQNIEISKN